MIIGNIKVQTPIILAPMAGVTDYPFRVLCKEMGAGIVYSEFVSAEGIIRENTKTLDMIHFKEIERPIGIQIFGNNPKIMGQAAKFVAEKFKPDILDINYGCPVPKITKKGGGSAALKDLCLMDEITSAVVESTPTNIPVTVKMRAGWDKNSIIIPKVGQRLQKIGIKAITLHPRTTQQRYTGKANWNYITQLKEACSIPIIGNGDVKTVDDMLKMFNETGCDAVMVGRVAQGNPWFFYEATTKLKGEQNYVPPTLNDVIDICTRHFNLLLESRGEKIGTNLMRKHFGNYVRGFPKAASFRKSLVTAPTLNDMKIALKEFKNFVLTIEK